MKPCPRCGFDNPGHHADLSADAGGWLPVYQAIEPRPSHAAAAVLIALVSQLDPATGCGRVRRGDAIKLAGVSSPKVAAEAARWALQHGLLIQLERGHGAPDSPVVSAWALAIPVKAPGHGTTFPTGNMARDAARSSRKVPGHGTTFPVGNVGGTPAGQPGAPDGISPAQDTTFPDPAGTTFPTGNIADVSPGQGTTFPSGNVARDAQAAKTGNIVSPPGQTPPPGAVGPDQAKPRKARSGHNVPQTRPPYVLTGVKDKDAGVANAPPAGHGDLGLDGLDPPSAPAKQPTENQRANKLASDYYEAVGGMCVHQAVAKVVLRAIRAGDWDDEEISRALARLIKAGREPTVSTLRIELNAPRTDSPRPGGREEPVYHEGPEYWRR